MLSADDYDAELAERYGWINRALPANALAGFVRSLAHRIAGFPAAGHVVVKKRVNGIALAPAEDFRRDSVSSARACATQTPKSASKPRSECGFQTRDAEMALGRLLATWRTNYRPVQARFGTPLRATTSTGVGATDPDRLGCVPRNPFGAWNRQVTRWSREKATIVGSRDAETR